MKYSIQGDTLPVVVCELDAGEKIITEGGGMPYPVILFFRIFTLQNVLTE